jgi:hypothetical protein
MTCHCITSCTAAPVSLGVSGICCTLDFKDGLCTLVRVVPATSDIRYMWPDNSHAHDRHLVQASAPCSALDSGKLIYRSCCTETRSQRATHAPWLSKYSSEEQVSCRPLLKFPYTNNSTGYNSRLHKNVLGQLRKEGIPDGRGVIVEATAAGLGKGKKSGAGDGWPLCGQ